MATVPDPIEKTRAWTGLYAVVVGDVVIAIAAILGVYWVKNGTAGTNSVVSILTSAFTAIGTLTTAYFPWTPRCTPSGLITPTPAPEGWSTKKLPSPVQA